MGSGDLVLSLSNTEILMNPRDVLFHVNMEITKRRMELESSMKSKKLQLGEYRGTVQGLGNNSIVVRDDKGKDRTIPLTRTRARQLLADTTTRK